VPPAPALGPAPEGASAATATASVAPTKASAGLDHLPGIDGLRAIAVAAVLVFHAGISALPGGFLGVEVFFVISGYLITALLLAEWTVSGRIALRRFWFRRARRLLPALFVVLLATLAFAVAWLPDEVARLRADAAAAAGYVSNWYLVLGEQSYFETAERQSPLLHLWSLAVEEQFYVLWPIVLAAGLALLRRRGMLVLTLAGAAASAAWMATLFDPAADPSRVYYGTDTRLTGLLLGAGLAFAFVPRATGAAHGGVRRRRLAGALADAAVVAGGLGLASAFALLDGGAETLYRGGFVVVGLSTVALIAGAVHPAGRIGRLVLERRPLRWLGTRSYGIYLWHWPIFSVTRPGQDVALDGPALFCARLLLTAVVAEISYRVVERPVRSGVLGRTWQTWRDEAWRAAPGTRSAWRTRAAFLTVAGALSVSGLLVTVASASPPERPPYLPVDEVSGVIEGSQPPAPPGPDPTAPAASAAPSARPGRTPAPVAPTPGPRGVLALGDSMLVATAAQLADALGRVEIDASIGRQVDEGIEILEARRNAGTLPDVVVLNLGVNGPLYKAQFERAMTVLRDVDLVVWVNVSVPRPWEGHTNKVLAQQVPRYPNARLLDWHALAAGHDELFWKDGYHPRPEGAVLYAELIAGALR
jgi:peptidoglycan/LPS O-acetylase OafA/YrhL